MRTGDEPRKTLAGNFNEYDTIFTFNKLTG